MDYPLISERFLRHYPNIHQLDGIAIDCDGVQLAGLGGVPNTVHPFRNVVEISPYEMTESEYERRLNRLWGVDVLLTHISPQEYPPLLHFVQNSPLKMLICRARSTSVMPQTFAVNWNGDPLKVTTEQKDSFRFVR